MPENENNTNDNTAFNNTTFNVSPMAKLVGLVASQGALATLVLHAVGYLALRHRLDVLAIETSLDVIDERYIFEGAKAVVHMLISLPLVVLILLPPSLLAYALYRRLPGLASRVERALDSVDGKRFMTGALVWSTLMVQLVMMRPFQLDDLLLSDKQLKTAWLRPLAFNAAGPWLSLYFGGLLVATAISLALYQVAWRKSRGSLLSSLLSMLAGTILVVQVLLLPINYGILTAGHTAPRVALPEVADFGPDQELWMVWETSDKIVVLARRGEDRRLVSLERAKTGRVETLCVDPLMQVLYQGVASRCGP